MGDCDGNRSIIGCSDLKEFTPTTDSANDFSKFQPIFCSTNPDGVREKFVATECNHEEMAELRISLDWEGCASCGISPIQETRTWAVSATACMESSMILGELTNVAMWSSLLYQEVDSSAGISRLANPVKGLRNWVPVSQARHSW